MEEEVPIPHPVSWRALLKVISDDKAGELKNALEKNNLTFRYIHENPLRYWSGMLMAAIRHSSLGAFRYLISGPFTPDLNARPPASPGALTPMENCLWHMAIHIRLVVTRVMMEDLLLSRHRLAPLEDRFMYEQYYDNIENGDDVGFFYDYVMKSQNELCRRDARLQKDYWKDHPRETALYLFSLVVVIGDDLVRHIPGVNTATARFFGIAAGLPMDLQRRLCAIVGGGDQERPFSGQGEVDAGLDHLLWEMRERGDRWEKN